MTLGNTVNAIDNTIHTTYCKHRTNTNDKNIKCASCNQWHHKRCHKVFARTRNKIKNWKCWSCLNIKATKCNHCKKTIARNLYPLQCSTCSKNFHKKCGKIYSKQVPPNWNCHQCTNVEFPFASLQHEEFINTINGIDNIDETKLNLLPSFCVKSLLDKITNHSCIETGEFESETVNSKYYTPHEFLAKKFPKSKFSILHLNIASLQAHINELRELLALLNHPFDLIAISETKLKSNCEIAVNIELDGYHMEHTPTDSFFGGVALYIKNTNKYTIRKELSLSEKM